MIIFDLNSTKMISLSAQPLSRVIRTHTHFFAAINSAVVFQMILAFMFIKTKARLPLGEKNVSQHTIQKDYHQINIIQNLLSTLIQSKHLHCE